MNNISGSAGKWVNNEDVVVDAKKISKRSYEEKENLESLDGEIITEDKVFDLNDIEIILNKLEKVYEDIDKIYQKSPKKDISDSSIMLKSAIRSLKNQFSKN